MRIFLIAAAFINSFIYMLAYAYYDTLLDLIGASLLSSGMQSFIRILILIIAGFCIGLIPMLILSPGMRRSRFDYKNLLLVGIIPFILLILSPGPINNFIATSIFSGSERIRELLFYLFSRQVVWSLWVGFAAGTSVRISFHKKTSKHAVSYTIAEGETINQIGDES